MCLENMCLSNFYTKSYINLFLGYLRRIDSRDLIRRQRLIYINKQSKFALDKKRQR